MCIKEKFKINNFDIVRLIAALQVVIHHAVAYLEIEHSNSVVFSLLELFPGVPIFFFVSGFLISKSYENNSLLNEYTQNRILRLYPALIVCTFFSLFSVWLTGYFENIQFSIGELIFWIVGQISFLQFYKPEFMREFGAGVLNGSLWSITVEIQFYIIVPILYWVFSLARSNVRNRRLLFFIALFIAFFIVFHIIKYTFNGIYSKNILFKLYGVSFIPWIWMFLLGVFFQKNFSLAHRIFSGKVLYVLPLYLSISYIAVEYFGWSLGNGINPIIFVLLAITIFSFAYSSPSLSKNLLKGNDISYGIYLYHMPIVNIFMCFGYMSDISYLYLVIVGTILLAILSWLIVERNSMRLKKHPLNPLDLANKRIG